MERPPNSDPSSRAGHVAIIGAGTWGTTLALVAARASNTVRLHVRDPQSAVEIETTRRSRRLPGSVQLPSSIRVTSDLSEACHGATLLIFAAPSQAMRENVRSAAPFIREPVIISAAKGLEQGSLKRMSEVIREELSSHPSLLVGALSGPNLAGEIAHGKPATTVIAGADPTGIDLARVILTSSQFRAYTNADIIGVEIGGALKNVIAIGAGIIDGLGAGENAKAAFVTRGIAEIARLGIALGADPLTFAGLSGLGDLVATCASPLSRNHRVGEEIAKGRPLPDILASMDQVAEGVPTTAAACELACRTGVELPIAEQMRLILFEGKSPLEAIADLMTREARDEHEGMRGRV